MKCYFFFKTSKNLYLITVLHDFNAGTDCFIENLHAVPFMDFTLGFVYTLNNITSFLDNVTENIT
jgi:hypothetical protein